MEVSQPPVNREELLANEGVRLKEGAMTNLADEIAKAAERAVSMSESRGEDGCRLPRRVRDTSIYDRSVGPTGLDEIFNLTLSQGGGRSDLALG
jgi:hypothetical protein